MPETRSRSLVAWTQQTETAAQQVWQDYSCDQLRQVLQHVGIAVPADQHLAHHDLVLKIGQYCRLGAGHSNALRCLDAVRFLRLLSKKQALSIRNQLHDVLERCVGMHLELHASQHDTWHPYTYGHVENSRVRVQILCCSSATKIMVWDSSTASTDLRASSSAPRLYKMSYRLREQAFHWGGYRMALPLVVFMAFVHLETHLKTRALVKVILRYMDDRTHYCTWENQEISREAHCELRRWHKRPAVAFMAQQKKTTT